MITLRNARLQIEIVEPGTAYTRTRFDWTGTCRQITLDGSVTYCAQEAIDDNPGTEGIGLCNEFGLHTPIGYDDAAVGAYFPKIGIGFLKKTQDRPYAFMVDYPLETASINSEQIADEAVTFAQTANRDGWGWNLRKTLAVHDNALTIAYALTNTGDRALNTEEYCHNFFAINGQTVGPDYQVKLSFQPQLEPILGPILVKGETITLSRIPEQSFWAAQTACRQQPDVTWTLTHLPSGHGLTVAEDFPLHLFQIWGMRHVISPEVFVAINIPPGDTQTWKRAYIFF